MNEPLSHWQSSLDMPLRADELPATADMCVLGGGLHGVCAAYWLARRGLRPVLLERGDLAAGATGRNGGLMVVGTAEGYPQAIERLGHARARGIYQITVENHALLLEVLREEQIEAGYREVGHLKLALGAEQLESHRHAAHVLATDGFGAELLDRAAIEQQIATPLGEEISGGLMLPHSGTVHSARLVHGLARAAQRHGARIVAGAEVRAIEQEGGGLLLRTARGDLRAGHVVAALNAWTGTLFPGMAGWITPVRGQALAYEPVAPLFRPGCSASVTPTGEYWHQSAEGTIVIGGCRAVAPGGDMGVTEQRPTEEVQAAIEGVLPRLFPRLPPLRVARRWAGLMAFTPNYTPVVVPAPGIPNTWLVGGFSGHGMPFGLRLGQLVARAALGEQPPELAHFVL